MRKITTLVVALVMLTGMLASPATASAAPERITPAAVASASARTVVVYTRWSGVRGFASPNAHAKVVVTYPVYSRLQVRAVKGEPKWWRVLRKNHRDVYVSRKSVTAHPARDLWPRVSFAKAYAKRIFPGSAYGCIDYIAKRESGWRRHASNGATWGIPQARPGSKMRSAGSDWRDNPATQLRWMRGYVNGRYGSACKAKRWWMNHRWY